MLSTRAIASNRSVDGAWQVKPWPTDGAVIAHPSGQVELGGWQRIYMACGLEGLLDSQAGNHGKASRSWRRTSFPDMLRIWGKCPAHERRDHRGKLRVRNRWYLWTVGAGDEAGEEPSA